LKEGAYRICEEHEFEMVKKSKQLTWGKDKKGKPITWKQAYDLYVPLGEGPKSTMCCLELGAGDLSERHKLNELKGDTQFVFR
jgi:hypothetical protein